MSDITQSSPADQISVLIIDDSLVFRRYLRDVCDHIPGAVVVGEGRNGIEALDLVLKLKPKIILMDMEMPMMDGATALQHLMIHRPTPTIIFSSLSKEGTIRAFDALKNGAVDFVCKDFIFQGKNLDIYTTAIIEKIKNASRLQIGALDPIMFASQDIRKERVIERHVIFCEDCGQKQILEIENGQLPAQIHCVACGDLLDISSFNKHKRISCVTLIFGGEGIYRNLLNSISRLESDLGGTLLAVIDDNAEIVDTFAEYLASVSNIKVIRASEDMKIEGGACYIFAKNDALFVKPLGTQYAFQKSVHDENSLVTLDATIASVSQIFKQRSAAIVLSGNGTEGVKGLEYMMKLGGKAFVLNPQCCFNADLPSAVQKNAHANLIENEDQLAGTITKLHASNSQDAL